MNDVLAFKLSKIPHSPGIYLWKNVGNEVIYVGKAIDLYNRTHQYFNKQHHLDKTSLLVKEIADVDFITVNNENESLILEANFIQKYQPKYNVLLKNSNNYPFIVLTDDQHPQIIYTRDENTKKGTYYGPFANTKFEPYKLYKLLFSIIPFRKCKNIPKRKCLYYDMKQCLGPCIKQINSEEYKSYIEQIDDFFNNKPERVLKQLSLIESKLSDELNFEEAKKINETIKTLSQISNLLKQTQIVNFDSSQSIDVVGFYINNGTLCITIFCYINGKLLIKNTQVADIYDSDVSNNVCVYLLQYYRDNKNKPKQIYVSLLNKHLCQLSELLNIKIINPTKGKYKQIIINAIANSKEFLSSNYLTYKNKINRTLLSYDDLKTLLGAQSLSLIHVFDMSNFFNTNRVGAMICIKNYKFDKSLYRKFNIKNINANSDTEYTYEVIKRQYNPSLKNFQKPNLIIVDGGKQQINACINALKEHQLEIPVIGLAKDKNHRTHKIVFSDKSDDFILEHGSNLLFLLQNIQDEVHRFAINTFKSKQIKQIFRSQFDNIDGIGSTTIEKLMNFYGSISKIKQADESEIAQLTSPKISRLIKKFLK